MVWYFTRRDFDLRSVAIVAVLILFGLAIAYVESARRPRRNYLRFALASSALGLVLIAMPLEMGAGLWIGLILWAGLSGAGLLWVHHYEHTEPR